MSLTQAQSDYPATQAKASQLAFDAATRDAQWRPVADDMSTLIALGNDPSADALAKGQAAFTDLGDHCRTVGVVISAG